MPLDGIVVKNIVCELDSIATGGRIEKIYQPSRDEIIVTIRAKGKSFKVLLNSNAGFPRLHFTTSKTENPQNPPVFCMTLRKHLSGGNIVGFFQPSMERIVEIRVVSLSELGDLSEKRLILEIMGKHSNIILVNEDGKIIDSIKRVGLDKSSVREVLPGKLYQYPPDQGKLNPLEATFQDFIDILSAKKSIKISDAIYKSYSGISPLVAVEVCVRAGVIPSDYIEIIDKSLFGKIFDSFMGIISKCRDNIFEPEIIYEGKSMLDFSSIDITQFGDLRRFCYSEISVLLEDFYGKKAREGRLKQKTNDLRKLLQNNIERCVKKSDILEKALKDTESMDEWRTCGELLTSYMSNIKQGTEFYDAQDYYNNNETKRIRIRTDLTPSQNAARYFEKYNKAKRQKIAATEQMTRNETELRYLEGVYNTVFSEITENEIQEIKQELFDQGYIKKNPTPKGMKRKKSEPLHFVSSDGFDIYVGKNNTQNDELTLRTASFNDVWLHTKDISGSHVILKTGGREPSIVALNEAALLAAFYSKARDGAQVPVDYTQKRNVKKPSGAKPGMVIYEKNKTAYVTPHAEIVELIKRVD